MLLISKASFCCYCPVVETGIYVKWLQIGAGGENRGKTPRAFPTASMNVLKRLGYHISGPNLDRCARRTLNSSEVAGSSSRMPQLLRQTCTLGTLVRAQWAITLTVSGRAVGVTERKQGHLMMRYANLRAFRNHSDGSLLMQDEPKKPADVSIEMDSRANHQLQLINEQVSGGDGSNVGVGSVIHTFGWWCQKQVRYGPANTSNMLTSDRWSRSYQHSSADVIYWETDKCSQITDCK